MRLYPIIKDELGRSHLQMVLGVFAIHRLVEHRYGAERCLFKHLHSSAESLLVHLLDEYLYKWHVMPATRRSVRDTDHTSRCCNVVQNGYLHTEPFLEWGKFSLL